MLKGYFDLPTITFFTQGNIWTGSLYTDFNYRITPISTKGDENTPPLKELHTQVWYGTLSYPLVKDFVSEYHEDMTENGLEKTISELTKAFEQFKKIRKTVTSDFKLH